PIVYLGDAGKTDLDKANITGKAVVVNAVPDGINLNVSLPEWRYPRYMMSKYGNELIVRGAAAVIFICDEYAEHSWPYARANFIQGTFDVEGGRNAGIPVTSPPVLWLYPDAASWIKEKGLTLKVSLHVESFTYPSVNILGKVPGTDPKLANEYVVLSSHTDAHGIRNIINNDSIYYGADDNASVTVAMFATAKALKKSPGKRPALLIIHGAEEKGLLGSRYFTTHPLIPLDSIAAVLNGDMIGRNHPDSAAVLGTQVPHQTSAELTQMGFDANEEGPKFKLDTLWDKPTHVEGWFFRSDHLPYARLGIPSLMYTTVLHPDYHTPMDNAENIDYPKLTKMAEWIYRTAWKVANAEHRPKTNADFELER
ncbi:MAG: M28 family peptidase, partial [Cyclobacteriaceae bacterium]